MELILTQAKQGSSYCIGGRNELANLDLVLMLCKLMDELAPKHGISLPVHLSQQLITFVDDRAGHDRRYAIDASKIEAELGWRPEVRVQEGLRRTVAWYFTHQDWRQPLLARSREV